MIVFAIFLQKKRMTKISWPPSTLIRKSKLFSDRRENKSLVLRRFRIVDVTLSWFEDGETTYPQACIAVPCDLATAI